MEWNVGNNLGLDMGLGVGHVGCWQTSEDWKEGLWLPSVGKERAMVDGVTAAEEAMCAGSTGRRR